MLMADLLVSTEGPIGVASPPVPMIDDLSHHFPAGSISAPTDLCQKICVLSDTLVLGWAGDYSTARTVIGELRKKNVVTPFSFATLLDHLDALPESIWDRLDLVGFIEDASGMRSFTSDKAIQVSNVLLGDIPLIGTGLTQARKILEGVSSLPTSTRSESLDPVSLSLGLALQLAGALLTQEGASLETLRDSYGGGYEIATVLNKKFAKVDDLAYLFWMVNQDIEGGLRIAQRPFRVCRYSYHDDLLLIRSVKLHQSGDSTAFEQRLFWAPPVYRDVHRTEQQAIVPPSLNARFMCHCFFIPTSVEKGEVLVHASYEGQSTGNKSIVFEERGNEIHNYVGKQFLLEVMGAIALRFGRN